jgi:hypothetical protein
MPAGPPAGIQTPAGVLQARRTEDIETVCRRAKKSILMVAAVTRLNMRAWRAGTRCPKPGGRSRQPSRRKPAGEGS